jgi:hypothetical protein
MKTVTLAEALRRAQKVWDFETGKLSISQVTVKELDEGRDAEIALCRLGRKMLPKFVDTIKEMMEEGGLYMRDFPCVDGILREADTVELP